MKRTQMDSIIKNDYYFVLGDNILYSMDSRLFCFIQDDDIVGKLLFVLN